ncbi:hypothetical protein [Massilia sp. S19_KUP03_FR1]|uniref:hypothetical protein n=1 Tax=Massilia sp. S19_KUP03_FR1 TaxID=3025503 RepID=UPI002FCD86E9
MRYNTSFAMIALALSLAGCAAGTSIGRVQVARLEKGISVSATDKIFDDSKMWRSENVEVQGTRYLFRHYELSEPGRSTSSTYCRKPGECVVNVIDTVVQSPFVLVFVGDEPQLRAWGKLSKLSLSTDPAIVAALPKIKSSSEAWVNERRSHMPFPSGL